MLLGGFLPPSCLQALAARCLVARGDRQATLAFGNSAPTGVSHEMPPEPLPLLSPELRLLG